MDWEKYYTELEIRATGYISRYQLRDDPCALVNTALVAWARMLERAGDEPDWDNPPPPEYFTCAMRNLALNMSKHLAVEARARELLQYFRKGT